MRFAVHYTATKIPLAYRMMVVSLIKESLKKANAAYYSKLYEKEKKEMKPFATAVYLNNFRIGDAVINLDGINIIFSSPDPEFIFNLYNGLLQTNIFKYHDFVLRREKVRFIPEKTIRKDNVVFRTLSPILIEDKEGNPLAPNDLEYENAINYYANLIIKGFRGKGLRQKLKVTPGRMVKQVIKESNHEFGETQKYGEWLYFTSYKGFIKLHGSPEDLQLLYQLGLSKRRGQSFGLLDVEREGV